MGLLTGSFKYDTVTFQGVTYILRRVHIPGWGEQTVASENLGKELITDGKYVSHEAENIDGEIFFYTDNWKLTSLSDAELAKSIAREVA